MANDRHSIICPYCSQKVPLNTPNWNGKLCCPFWGKEFRVKEGRVVKEKGGKQGEYRS